MNNCFGTVVNHWSSTFFAVSSVGQKTVPSDRNGCTVVSFIEVLFCFWIKFDI